MTPPDQPEEAPSALSRLERALAGFGDPKSPAAETEEEPAAEEPAAAEEWASPSSSVLDIAAAVAAVEKLGAVEPSAPEPPAPPDAPVSDADSIVLAASAAGAADDDPRFEPADLRARIQEFEDDGEPDEPVDEEPEPEPVEDEPVDEAPEPEPEPEREPERNIGDPSLPYFLVEENLPVAADPVAPPPTIEELRETHARPAKAPKPPKPPKPPKEPKEADERQPASIARTLAEIPVLLIVAALIAFLVKTFLAQAYYIPSGSMLPQLQIDDRVVVSKLAYKAHDPRRGDIIVFDDPRTGASTSKGDEGLLRKVGEGIGIVQPSTDEFIKRVIGLPGETVEGKNGHVYVNGQRLIEPYLKDSVVTMEFDKQKIKPGHLWVMGDNRTGSADSRVFGQIKTDTIVGRALVKVWPVGHISFL